MIKERTFHGSDVNKATSLFIDYFGSSQLFGTDSTGGYSIKEICKKLHIKYDPEYENT